MKARVAALVVLAVLAAGCGAPAPGHAAPSGGGQPNQGRPDPAAVVAAMADEDLVGQVLMPYAYGNDATKVSAGSAAGNRKYAGVATPAEMIAKYRLGGLILVGFSADDPTAGTSKTTNLDSPQQVRALTAGLQAAAGKLKAGLPLLVGTDQEYGVVTRIRTGVTQLPSPLCTRAGTRSPPATCRRSPPASRPARAS